MKPITISPVSLVLGAVFAAGLFLVMGQAAPTSFGTWGPPKKGVVNVFNSPGSPVPASGSVVLFQVPQDRWLTITNASISGVGCACSGYSCLRFAEELGGVVIEKGYAGYSPSGLTTDSAVGWVFRPGSRFIIWNQDTSPCSFASVSFLGYETRD